MDLSEGKGKGTSASNPCGTDSGEMQQESNKKMSDMLWRPWDSLPPELLELIFNHCPLHDKLMIQGVCKSWNKVTASPFVWQKIDMLEWSKNRDPATLNRMLLRLFNNLCSGLGPPKRLLIHGVSDLTFPLITASAENLTTLKIPWSVISNEMVIQEATKLSTLRFLDLSYCRHIGAPAIRAIGRHCRLLTGFRRIVHKNVRLGDYDDEAYAIAATMHQLRSLELHYLNFSNQLCVLKILSCCTKLKYLDLRMSFIPCPVTKEPTNLDSRGLYYCSGRSRRDIRIRTYVYHNSWENILLRRRLKTF